MKVAVLFSGGKDSAFAAEVCRMSGWEVVLLAIKPAMHSTMFHYPNIKWCKRQAEAMGLPIKIVKAKGKLEEDELDAIKKAILELGADAVAAGAIESEYQKERIDKIAYEIGIRSFAPIWRTGESLLHEQCKYFEAHVVAVAAEGLKEDDLGKRFDFSFLERLRKMNPPVSLHFEGGEGETFVAHAPFFEKKLRIKRFKKIFDGASGFLEITSLA
ncbi:MAG: diphthine--ammonia ligase [Candidatus Micrarchaeota archaeon]|nr:diphthine--ammonia ligase [Candidatus Micrarchaeota archaeon]